MPLDMNYFNYYTEIEQEFVKRRGSHMLVSPLDWALIENWKQRGIPLHIVLRGINASFDGYDQRKHRGRKVNTLFFCSQEVEAMFEEYVESRVGGSNGSSTSVGVNNANGDSPFGASQLIAYLLENCETLERLRDREEPGAVLEDTFARTAERLAQIVETLQENDAFSPELLETDLTMIEEVILDGLKEHAGPERLGELRKEGKQQLRAYKQTMEREIYDQTLNNFIARRLREVYRVPRLSLFYL
ncbi:MAG: hypothetical protein ACREEM_33890 [Blastocatellia bacterium]